VKHERSKIGIYTRKMIRQRASHVMGESSHALPLALKILTIGPPTFMGPKRKRDETTPMIRSFDFSHDNPSDSDNAHQT